MRVISNKPLTETRDEFDCCQLIAVSRSGVNPAGTEVRIFQRPDLPT